MPKHQCPGVCREVGFVQRQPRTKKAQAFKSAEFRERLLVAGVDRERKSGLISEQSEKYQVMFVEEILDLRTLEQHGVRRFAPDQAKVSPYRNETRFFARDRVGKPVRILATLATAIDKRACKYVVAFHCW